MEECTKLLNPKMLSSFYFSNNNSQQSLAQTFYKLANSFLDQKELVKGLDCICDTFLLRNVDITTLNDEFLEFFKIQFVVYLLGKKKIKVALSEGDMIFDLIEDTFKNIEEDLKDSPFRIKDENRRTFYKTVEIDFPWMLFDESFFA